MAIIQFRVFVNPHWYWAGLLETWLYGEIIGLHMDWAVGLSCESERKELKKISRIFANGNIQEYSVSNN